ncbi:MAG: nucleoid-associated protein [Bacteroidota bacterium]|nr:nucleoid-associated protein [Bacteroidota bacterium]
MELPKIINICLHSIGNKHNGEDICLSSQYLNVSKDIKETLVSYFILPFQSDVHYNFYHESDINLNEVFVYVNKIFNNPNNLLEQSVYLTKHLFEQSNHPKIKGGEFYIVHFQDCILDGSTMDAVGLFKSENKETFLKVFQSGDGFEIEREYGVNINKLDKGCLIFNTEQENGYVVAVVDNTNKGVDAHYWINDFLHIRPRKDEYYDTQNILSLCRNFITKDLPLQFETTKADQVDLLNKAVKFFKEKETFNLSDFTKEVIEQPAVIESFNKYKVDYAKEREIDISESFTISNSAVKKQARSLKRIIKLDKNFDILIHGTRDLIEQGIEEDGRKYYKIYYREER